MSMFAKGCVLSKLQSRTEMIAVLEYGFGTAMGFLLTAAAARVLQAPLRFVSLEKWLLPAPVLEGVHRPLLADPYLFSTHRADRPWPPSRGRRHFGFTTVSSSIASSNGERLFRRIVPTENTRWLAMTVSNWIFALAMPARMLPYRKRAKRSYSMPSISMPSVRNRVRIYGAPRPCGELTLV